MGQGLTSAARRSAARHGAASGEYVPEGLTLADLGLAGSTPGAHAPGGCGVYAGAFSLHQLYAHLFIGATSFKIVAWSFLEVLRQFNIGLNF